jgi:hypothetical protein
LALGQALSLRWIFIEFVSQTVSEIWVGGVKTIKNEFPLDKDGRVNKLFGREFVAEFKPILERVLLNLGEKGVILCG